MNWEAIGALGEVFGGLAVILSLLFVGRQIKTSSQIALSASERAIMDSWKEINSGISSNLQTAEAYTKGLSNFDELNEAERQQFRSLCVQFFCCHGNALQMYNRGMLDNELLEAIDRGILGLLKSDGGARWWKSFKTYHPETQQVHVKKLLSDENIGTAFNETQFSRGS
jgi:hypothetical protein